MTDTNRTETVKVLKPAVETTNLWAPTAGEETVDLLSHLGLDQESADRVRDEAVSVLAKSIPPNEVAETTTGLVIGYVQSGKTMSFTTVSALARDNGYPMVIVITGVATNLLGQSAKRLEEDLRLETRNDRKWHVFTNPKKGEKSAIQAVLDDWKDNSVPDFRRKTVLITVLKNHSHLQGLIRLLNELKLAGVPVLIIDDEADQAGLNNLVRRGPGQASTTYQRLVSLRSAVPHHTYLQYTATPQAPLLINLIDILSPGFAEVLTPGDDYTGGREFFKEGTEFIRTIPSAELGTTRTPLLAPPESLLAAMKLFFLGVAAGYVRQEDTGKKRRNRSMLVHPSQDTTGHGQFHRWISQIRDQWLELLKLDSSDPERSLFVEEFRPAYDDLLSTVDDLPAFDDLINVLAYSLRTTMIQEVNSAQPGGTPAIDWKASYPFILVGGQAMDRGYTVEGLTVTYMPRSLGVGNADTIQQRARFFGYKKSYLGYCRVFLSATVRNAFEVYVKHEEDIRSRLLKHKDEGRPLSEWRRAFFLNTALSPTRSSVLGLASEHDTVSDDWYWPKTPHGPASLLDSNRTITQDFLAKCNLSEDEGDVRRTEEQKHLVAEAVPLVLAYEELLAPMMLTEASDSERLTGVRLQIDAHLRKYPDALCTVYQMSKGKTRLRSVSDMDEQEIPTLFQGANYTDNQTRKDMIYPGDDAIRGASGVTIQIHTLTIREPGRGRDIATDVPTIAVWIPKSMENDWYVQSEAN